LSASIFKNATLINIHPILKMIKLSTKKKTIRN